MNREDAKKAAEVMLAYADGKTIQFRGDDDALHNEWQDITDPAFNFGDFFYRIKPESPYRPFKSAEECLEEMKKHEPFGWIANGTKLYSIKSIECNTVLIDDDCYNQTLVGYFNSGFTFADGTPFGKLTEEE